MKGTISRANTVAGMLDELSKWALEQAQYFPIRSSFHDALLVRAAARSRSRALAAYKASRSIDEGLQAGKETFTEVAGPHSIEMDLIRSTSRRSTPELWIESSEEKEIATG